jgi:hypothetical protein
MFHKSPNYAGLKKIYNHLPADIKDLEGDTSSLKKALKNYLNVHSFHTMD